MMTLRHCFFGFILLMSMMVFQTGCSLFSITETVDQDPQGHPEYALKITAPRNSVAHIFRYFPDIDDEVEEIVMEAKLYAPADVQESAWLSSLILYWKADTYVKVGQTGTGTSRAMGPGTIATVGNSNGGALGLPSDTWIDARISIKNDHLEISVRDDGDWIVFAENDLTASGTIRTTIRETFPAEIMLGKGHRTTSGDNPADHLDDSAPPDKKGAVETQYIADLVLSVNGEVVLRENFESLDGWDMHVDPQYADEITIEAVPVTF